MPSLTATNRPPANTRSRITARAFSPRVSRDWSYTASTATSPRRIIPRSCWNPFRSVLVPLSASSRRTTASSHGTPNRISPARTSRSWSLQLSARCMSEENRQ